MSRARTHPGPLPWGEGETVPAFWQVHPVFSELLLANMGRGKNGSRLLASSVRLFKNYSGVRGDPLMQTVGLNGITLRNSINRRELECEKIGKLCRGVPGLLNR
jgi:hypothetical protein